MTRHRIVWYCKLERTWQAYWEGRHAERDPPTLHVAPSCIIPTCTLANAHRHEIHSNQSISALVIGQRANFASVKECKYVDQYCFTISHLHIALLFCLGLPTGSRSLNPISILPCLISPTTVKLLRTLLSSNRIFLGFASLFLYLLHFSIKVSFSSSSSFHPQATF